MDAKITWGIVILVIVVIIIGGFYWLWTAENVKAARLDAFATCITQSGAKMYGAFWCPHCQSQKAMFDTLFTSSSKKLDYVECSTPDAKGQLEVCKTEKIDTYPTWRFGDGSQNKGEMTLQQLAEKTGCALP